MVCDVIDSAPVTAFADIVEVERGHSRVHVFAAIMK